MSDKRKSMANTEKDVVIPVPPPLFEMDKAYFDLRNAIIERVKRTRLKFVMQANQGMIELYWNIGNEILKKQESEGWGARVIDRLSDDMRKAFPEMNGFSPRNLKYMRKFAESWSDFSIVQQAVAQLPWRSILTLMSKIKDNETREIYAVRALSHGWSSNVLHHMIDMRYIEREGKSVTNFAAVIPPQESDMAVQIFKDPYIFDFIGTAAARREAELERSLVSHMEKFLLELGQGFAFVGRQVHLEVGGDDFYIDLLFYHLKLRCYIVVELKARKFDPGDVAQLGFYQAVVDDVLRHPDDNLTIGLLLVKEKNRTVVEYSMRGHKSPISVADWQNEFNVITEEIKSSLPTVEEIEKEIAFLDSKIIDAGDGDE